MDDTRISEELLTLHEELLKAQLQTIHRLRGPAAAGQKQQQKSKSNMSIVIDLLKEQGKPLHVSEIIRRAKEQDVILDRESLVSALVKKVRSGVLVRTAPNTFSLLQK